jgi:hypothetical protein
MNRNYKYLVAVLFIVVCAAATAKEIPLAPMAPSNISLQAMSDDSVMVRWYDNSRTEMGFTVQRSADGVNWRQVATISADEDVFFDHGLDPSTRYIYRVAAFNRGGRSDFSRSAAVQTFRLAGNYPL